MAKGIQNYPQIDTTNPTAYPNGNIKDAPSGTPVNVVTNADLHQTFDKLLRELGTTANNTPDNETNGFQYVKAMLQLLPNKYIVEDVNGLDGATTVITRASIQSAAAMNSLPISVAAFDFARKVGSATSDKLRDFHIQAQVQRGGSGAWTTLGIGSLNTDCAVSINDGSGDITVTWNLAPATNSKCRIILIG